MVRMEPTNLDNIIIWLNKLKLRYMYFISISALAAPFIEDCPSDSKLDEDHCICNPESCVKPPCLTELEVHEKGTDEPGSCCPIYSCIGL